MNAPTLETLLAHLPNHLLERARPILGPRNSSQSSSTVASERPIVREGPVVYWTHHAQRTDENPALDVARWIAHALKVPLIVYQGLSATYRYASDRHHAFQLQAARDLHQAYRSMGIRYVMHLETRGDSASKALLHLAKYTSVLITDDFPGEPTDRWMRRLSHLKDLPIIAVDTACVVPMQRVGRAFDRAFAFRDATKTLYQERIGAVWPSVDLPPPVGFDASLPFSVIDWDHAKISALVATCPIDHSIPPVADTEGGSLAGYDRWNTFLAGPLRQYEAKRNDPLSGVASRMSAYLHYGMVSPMRLARDAHARRADKYLDELLIWRELAYGYCFYSRDYDQWTTIPAWARNTLKQHECDPREAIYTWEDLARGVTEDRLWNACQHSLVRHGELHNNVRMTWGKALLKWTKSGDEALKLLIDLNHRFALDGRDPASYGGILWCFGQFDRPFQPEQPVIGTVRDRSTREHLGRIRMDAYERHVHRSIGRREPKIAIVGTGIAGLACARALQDCGVHVTLFDKSKRPGGRCASKPFGGTMVDYGPAYFMLDEQRWGNLIASWRAKGLLAPWEKVSTDASTATTPGMFEPSGPWVGVPTMNAVAQHLCQGLAIHLQHEVSELREDGEQYRLAFRLQGADAGDSPTSPTQPLSIEGFDAVLLNTPPQQAAALVPCTIPWRVDLVNHPMRRCWTLLIAFEHKWSVLWNGMQLSDEVFSWLGRESSKPGRDPNTEVWVAHATAEWSKEHLEERHETVNALLVAELQARCRHWEPGVMASLSLPPIRESSVHRWRFAQSIETPPAREHLAISDGCLWDEAHRIGVFGDWAGCDTRPRSGGIGQALNSGNAMAGRILNWIVDSGVSERTPRAPETGYHQLRLFE